MKKAFGLALITLSLLLYGVVPVQSAVSTPIKQSSSVSCQKVIPTNVVANPSKYLNKDITFDADFIAFSGLGLDYKPAFRDSGKYIGLLIKRDDTPEHQIPLSEFKIFLKRELAEELSNIDSGDRIRVTGKVFSTALGDPWMDASDLKILTKKETDTEKKSLNNKK